MSEQTILKWTKGLVALSIPLVLTIAVVFLMIIGGNRMGT